MRVIFGEYAPDLPPLVNQKGLVQAKNMRPKGGGYEPVNGLNPLPGATALTARPRGSISGIDASGSGYLYVASGDLDVEPASKLWVQRDAATTDISSMNPYVLGATERWSFAKFGNHVFAACYTAPMQQHLIGSPLAFADVPQLAPRARHIATIGNFLFAGNIYDPQEGPMPDAYSHSALNDPLVWPVIGSNDAAAVQADRQPLEGNGGWIQDIASGAEIGAVFQERAIHRLDYVGPPAIWQPHRMEEGNGMFVPYSAVAFERLVFYIAEDGFRIFDYTSTQSIGKARISATFLADLDTQYIDRVECAKDPDRTVIWIIYPGVGNTGGRPNKVIWYDYALDKFSHGALELEGLIENASTTPQSIDAPASPGDPDDVDDVTGEDSFDDRPTASGSSRMGAFSTTFVANDFSGSALEGLIETGDIEGAPGRFYFIDEIRPLVDGRNVEIAVAEMNTRQDDVIFGPYLTVDSDGTIPIRSDARYHRLRIKLPAGWEEAVGLDITGESSGER